MIDKTRLQERVVRQILSSIAQGEYPLGRRLPAERRLCQQFGISRGTLRKSLGELSRMGVLRVRHGSGAYVQGLRLAAIPKARRPHGLDNTVGLQQIIEAREAIEVPAARAAALHMTPAVAREMAGLLREMTQSGGDLARFMAADMAFHRAMVCACRNKALVAAYDAIREYHRFSQAFTSYHEGECQRTVAQHGRILEALKGGDPAAVAAALRHHLSDMHRYVRRRPARRGEGS